MSLKELQCISTRKRNIIYLIEDYLKKEGYTKSALSVQEEANLQNDYVICDNVNLENIVIDFEAYYHLRFQTYPSLCKKLHNNVVRKFVENRTAGGKREKRSLQQESPKSIVSTSEGVNKQTNSKLKLSASNFIVTRENNNLDMAVTSTSMLTLQTKEDSKKELILNKSNTTAEWTEYLNIVSKVMENKFSNVRWDDVKGLDEAKQVLKEAILYPIKHPALFNMTVTPWKSVLLYGPPGTGKTMLAKAICNESGAKFFNISSSTVISKWRGDSEKLIRAIFELADQHGPSVIFIEEIDSLASKRNQNEHEASRRLKSELFTLIDDILYSNNNNVFLLATSNIPWDLDEAMVRRFEKQLLISMPNVEIREQMLKKFLPEIINEKLNIICDINYSYAAKITEGYSGSDIKSLSKQILMESMKDYFLAIESENQSTIMKYKKTIKSKDIEDATKKIKPSVTHLENKYLKWQMNRK